MAVPHDPEISWGAGGVPASERFGDIYFSTEDGLAESRHVFLGGIGAPEIWSARRRYTIGELGFGTGLNFAATCDLWRKTSTEDAHLNYLAVEGYPMSPGDLARALRKFPEIAEAATPLIESWPARGADWGASRDPDRDANFHHLRFPGRVTLLVIFKPVEQALEELSARVDAWFLDGFAPSKNPEMWTDKVIGLLAARSAKGARLATFTAAGAVRRALSDAGFSVNKRPGFGAKRDSLHGVFEGSRRPTGVPHEHQPIASLPDKPRVAVIGAGIAGASAAFALAGEGALVSVFDARGRAAAGASGPPAAVLQPRPLADSSPAAAFFAAAYTHAGQTYDRCGVSCLKRGVLVLGRDDGDRERYHRLPFGRLLSANEANDLAGVAVNMPGVVFEDGGVLDAGGACDGLLRNVDWMPGTRIRSITHNGGAWSLNDTSGAIYKADAVVLAGGMETLGLCPDMNLGLHANRGQISLYGAPAALQGLKCALTFGGYLTPSVFGPGGASVLALGGTFERVDNWSSGRWRTVRQKDHQRNAAKLSNRLAHIAASLGSAKDGWTGLRATTPDRLPLLGRVPDNDAFKAAAASLRHGGIPQDIPEDMPEAAYQPGLFVLSGLGSRGFLTGPLCGEILASQMFQTPLPVSGTVASIMAPARFLARAMKKNPA